MGFDIRTGVTHQFRSGWLTTSRAPTIETQPYRQMRHELVRHLCGETQGRSFLIAGHRGAGKTAMVQAVVDDVRDAIFRAIETGDMRHARRRPLLVRLYGPALLGQEAAPAETGAGAASETAGTDKPAAAGAAQANAGGDGGEPVLGALVQITVALYRALAAEIMEGFLIAAQSGVKARLDRGIRPGDLAELAAGLQLAIDAGAEAATLRAFWSRLDLPRPPTPLIGSPPASGEANGPSVEGDPGTATSRGAAARHRPFADDVEHRASARSGVGCLGAGVLWPPEKGEDPTDRGFREITTLVTATQAFRVCIGKLTAKETREEASARDDKAEANARLDGANDLAQKLLTAVAGLGVGLGVKAQFASPGWAVAAGLAAAFTTTLTLGRSSSRSAKGEWSLSTSFLPEYTVQSLDRDLPFIIDRIRAIGLQPVFVVDELDKLVGQDVLDPKVKVDLLDRAMSRLMRRLKQLTTDNGFFCFLTDRDYFDHVENRLDGSVYAIEHSFFTHRLLVAHRPDEVAAYVRSAVETSPPGGPRDAATQATALMIGRVAMHRSRLNATDLVRALSVMAVSATSAGEGEAAFRAQPLNRLETIVQLAVEHVMRQPRIGRRIADRPQFVQVAGDVCYMISRAWARGDAEVAITRHTVEAEIVRRMRWGDDRTEPLTSGDLDAFVSGAAVLAELLCDFEALEALLLQDQGFVREDAGLLGVFQPPLLPLLRKGDGETYRFVWDAFGLLIDTRSQPAGIDVARRLQTLIVTLRDSFGLSLDDLVGIDLLPPTLTGHSITQACSRLLLPDQRDHAAHATDQEALVSLDSLLTKRAPALTALLALARFAVFRLRGVDPVDLAEDERRIVAVALLCIRRYLDVPGLVEKDGDGLRRAVSDDLLDVDHLLVQLALSRRDLPGSDGWASGQLARLNFAVIGTSLKEDGWPFWLDRVKAHLDGRSVGKGRIVDVAYAMDDRLPGSVFERDLSRLTIADWSLLVLEGALFSDHGAPTWTVPAGLYALGFGQEMLQRVSKQFTSGRLPRAREDTAEIAFAEALAAKARPAQKALLDIVSRPESLAGLRQDGDQPILQIKIEAIGRYAKSLDWLQRFGAFEGRTDDGL